MTPKIASTYLFLIAAALVAIAILLAAPVSTHSADVRRGEEAPVPPAPETEGES